MILTNENAQDYLQQFEIHQNIWNYSDHVLISVKFILTTQKENLSIPTSEDLLSNSDSSLNLAIQKMYRNIIDNGQASYIEKISNLKQSCRIFS